MSTLTTFHLFPTLPVEIRLKIWSFGLSTPRTVSISCEREATIRGAYRTVKSWTSDTPSPPLLAINRESRHEALTIYAPCFTTPSSQCIYLSFPQDTVKLVDNVLPYIRNTHLLNIQKLALETNDCAYFGFYNMSILMSMKRLRELDIYVRGGPSSWGAGDRYLNMLIADFEEVKEEDPGWECPMIMVFYGDKGRERIVEGGAKIPGWKPEERVSAIEVENSAD